MHTPPHPVHIALATVDEARDLAALLADQGDALPGVGGQRGPAEACAAEWVARTGATSSVAMEVGRYDLPTRPHVPFVVSGSFRLADGTDIELVDLWHQQFVDAIEGQGRVVPSLDRHVADGRVGLWEDAGRTVSMAYASPASGGVTRISGVWTPPELRGHGYASGVVAALSAARLDAGEACMLYTDLANPTSNAIYGAMGYRRVGDSISIALGERA
jgi:predicted GNAT family acetyltransferase